MLLGSGNLLDKLPLTQIGGVINNTNWMNPSLTMVGVDTFDKTSSLPNGYGGQAFYLPMKAGGISGYSHNELIALSNGNNSYSMSISDATATLSGTVTLGGSSTCLLSATSSIMAIALASGNVSIICTVSGDIVSVLNASGGSLSLCTANGTIIGAVNGIGNSTAILTISANMVGIFEGYGSSGSVLSVGIATIDGKANAVISINSNTSVAGDIKAKGFMGGSNTSVDTALTAKDVWEYYQRTLTSGVSDSFTLEQIADAVWSKAI